MEKEKTRKFYLIFGLSEQNFFPKEGNQINYILSTIRRGNLIPINWKTTLE
jgi:hypothetical protein